MPELWSEPARSLLRCMRREVYLAERFELKHFLFEQLPHEFLHVDGKLPRTIRLLLTQPGALAKNYVAGRRRPFVGPLRLYIVLFLLQVILGAVVVGPGRFVPGARA